MTFSAGRRSGICCRHAPSFLCIGKFIGSGNSCQRIK
ncbi:hypothetical protein EVA_20742 [gut metagenome]|uniref:Uncharacterized protein n=1 Tax=gut metagenome TaxID=749906 RepID=J9FNJ4_9ZZZZ